VTLRRSSRHLEVAALVPQDEIRKEARGGGNVLAEVGVLVAQQCKPAERQAKGEHGDQGREDAPDAPAVERDEAEISALKAFQDDRGDQEAGDDEENVDADEAAFDMGGKGVKPHHEQNGHRPQAVDVGAIGR
jgi:hypothetical protein